jgi:hypothetical protein
MNFEQLLAVINDDFGLDSAGFACQAFPNAGAKICENGIMPS